MKRLLRLRYSDRYGPADNSTNGRHVVFMAQTADMPPGGLDAEASHHLVKNESKFGLRCNAAGFCAARGGGFGLVVL